MRPQDPKLARAPALALWLALAGGCVPVVQRPAPLTCAPPCGSVREVTAPDTLAIGLHVTPGTRLRNAAVASLNTPACKTGIPVVAVAVDEQIYPEGPAWLDRHSSLILRFPFTHDRDAPEAAVSPPLAVDLDLEWRDGSSCLRLPLPDPGTGLMSLIRQLSLRLEPRE